MGDDRSRTRLETAKRLEGVMAKLTFCAVREVAMRDWPIWVFFGILVLQCTLMWWGCK